MCFVCCGLIDRFAEILANFSPSSLEANFFLEIPIVGDKSGNLVKLTTAIQLAKKLFQYF